MIRVGFVVARADAAWLGGVNYLSNLCHAVMAQADHRIEPVVIAAPETPSSLLAGFPPLEIIRTPLVARRDPRRLAGKVLERIVGRNLPLERFLRAKRVAILSHSAPLGPGAATPTLAWIADFQHLRLPELFSDAERMQRSQSHRRSMLHAALVIVSSRDAQRDLAAFDPQFVERSRVLNFVPGFGSVSAERSIEDLRAAYAIDRPYFFLPNQFWKHKNHRVVIDALAILRNRGRPLLVVSTGHGGDYRHPHYHRDLMTHAQAQGVGRDFKTLGIVPYDDVSTLMRHAIAVLNPSLFEGWSTTVEEAKSTGKVVILSDISVHREQAPERGVFFEPRDPAALASIMMDVASRVSPSEETAFAEKAARDLPARIRRFAREYEDIVTEGAERAR